MGTSGTDAHARRLIELRVEYGARCAEYLRTFGPSTVLEISNGTELSRQTVRDRLRDLVQHGLVANRGTVLEAKAAGRPADVFEFVSSAGFVVGIEMSRERDLVVFCDISGRILERTDFDDPAGRPAVERAQSLCDYVKERVAVLGEAAGRWEAMAVAVPGLISPDGLHHRSTTFPEWAGLNLRSRFEAMVPVPVTVINDTKAAGLAEHLMGSAAAAEDFVYVLPWHQIAASIFIGGRVHRGSHQLAGELNQLTSTQRADDDQRWPSTQVVQQILERAGQGDLYAHADIRAFATKAAAQTAALVLSVDPELIVLGGALGAHPVLQSAFTEALESEIRPPLKTPVVIAATGGDGPVFGVLLACLDSVSKKLLGPTSTGPRSIIASRSADHPPRTSTSTQWLNAFAELPLE